MAALSFSGTTLPTTASESMKQMARMGFEQFAELAITDQQFVLALAQHLKSLNSPELPEA